ncbi:MAG: hypothetical protein JNK28_13050 [Burkholderiaceae bacterium]|jgi:hypothetical protein|nr:hypothetical protein [Burkholderiaceae bacterium]
MRFRLLRRRLTISASRMAIRSAMPWPIRWGLAAVVMGFCAAIGLWAFEFGKEIAGLDRGAKQELAQLRQEVVSLREERDKAQTVANTSGSLLTAEKVAQERLVAQLRHLEAENAQLRDDLGFFEKLAPVAGTDGIAIRGLQVERLSTSGPTTGLRWQVLVQQLSRQVAAFDGRIDVVVSGTLDGKTWTSVPPLASTSLQFSQHRRATGLVELPARVIPATLTVRVIEGQVTRASQTVKI